MRLTACFLKTINQICFPNRPFDRTIILSFDDVTNILSPKNKVFAIPMYIRQSDRFITANYVCMLLAPGGLYLQTCLDGLMTETFKKSFQIEKTTRHSVAPRWRH